MAGGKFSEAQLHGMTIRESADDGSDFTNAPADYRRLFLGEDGQLHVKDSSGTVTGIGGAIADILDLDTAETDDTLVLAPDGAGGVEFRAEAGGGGPVELAYVAFTSTVSPASTGGTPITEANTTAVVSAGAVAFDGATDIQVEFFASLVRGDSGGGTISLYLFDGSTPLGRIGYRSTVASSAASGSLFLKSWKFTPSNASHTYSIRAAVGSGTGAISAGSGGTGPTDSTPGYIRIVTVP